jgi:hypothetical protein
MNSLQKKWQSRRIKHELSTKQMAVNTNQTWTIYTTNGCQDDRVHVWIVLTAICCVESSCLIRVDCHLFGESSCLIRLDCHLFCREDESNMNSTKQMAVKTNQTWTLYKTNGGQDESNMNSLQNKWQSRRVHIWFVLTAFCFGEFMFDSSWQPFLL